MLILSAERTATRSLLCLASSTQRILFEKAASSTYLPNSRRSRGWFSLRCLQCRKSLRCGSSPKTRHTSNAGSWQVPYHDCRYSSKPQKDRQSGRYSLCGSGTVIVTVAENELSVQVSCIARRHLNRGPPSGSSVALRPPCVRGSEAFC